MNFFVNDLPDEVLDTSHYAAIDTETTGLDHRNAKPVLFQYHSQEFGTYLVRLTDNPTPNIAQLLSSDQVSKVFHHAPFDMRMLMYNRGYSFSRVYCTKVAAKLLDPNHKSSQSYKNLCADWLGIDLEKESAVSDWTLPVLTEQQINYAIRDVTYLLPLYAKLLVQITTLDLLDKYHTACQYLPLVVSLECAKYDLKGLYGY